MPITKITCMADYNAVMEKSKTQLVVIDFSAEWCGPCKFIHPIYERLSGTYSDVVFAEVDVDEADDVAAKCAIRAMPTFQFYKNGAKVEEMMGADANKLESLLKTLK